MEAGLREKAWSFLSDACRKAEEEVQSCPEDSVDSSGVVDTFMALANFCDKVLREQEQSDAGVFLIKHDLPRSPQRAFHVHVRWGFPPVFVALQGATSQTLLGCPSIWWTAC